jgi:hypothetical protein
MGVQGREVPQELLDHERVTEPRVGVSVVVDRWPSGLLQRLLGLDERSSSPQRPSWSLKPRPRTVQVHALLWCVAKGNARVVRSVVAHVDINGAGPAAAVVDAASDHGFDVVRYKRPGFFVLLVVVSEVRDGKDAATDAANLAALGSVDVAGAPVDIAALHAHKDLTAIGPVVPQQWGSVVVARGAADRVREQIPCPFVAADGTVAVTINVDLRL